MALDLTGVMVATVTPFKEGGAAVDHEWMAGHLRFLEDAGITSVFPLGTNGEGTSVAVEERKRVIETVVRHKGGMGVVAGAGTPSLPDTIRAANDALDAGADAVAILPPYFYADADAAGLVAYYSAVIEALPSQGRVLLYNIPSKAQVDIPDEVALALLELHGDQVIGIKDSSGEVERTRRYVELSPELAVLAGRTGTTRSCTASAAWAASPGSGTPFHTWCWRSRRRTVVGATPRGRRPSWSGCGPCWRAFRRSAR